MATVRERETFGKCPSKGCGGDIVEGEKNYFCTNYKNEENGGKGCKVTLPKLIMGHAFPKKEARDFFEGELKTATFEGFRGDGNEVKFFMEYDPEIKEVKVRFINDGDSGGQTPAGKCPNCGKNVFESKKNFFCEGYKDDPKCDFVIYKEAFGVKFTKQMVSQLLGREQIDDVSCFTKEGKEYKAGFKINDEGDFVQISYGGGKRE